MKASTTKWWMLMTTAPPILPPQHAGSETRAGLERGEVVRRVREGYGANGGQGDAGVPVSHYKVLQGLGIPDGAQVLHEARGDRRRAGSPVPSRDIRGKTALLEHGAIERQGQIPRQLDLECFHACGAI